MIKLRRCPNCGSRQPFLWTKKLNKIGVAWNPSWECNYCQSRLKENKYSFFLIILIVLLAEFLKDPKYLKLDSLLIEFILPIEFLMCLVVLYILPLRIADSSKEN